MYRDTLLACVTNIFKKSNFKAIGYMKKHYLIAKLSLVC